MVNPKRKKFSENLKNISEDMLGDHSLLSSDLAERIGSLADRTKVTIRLDSRIIESAKKLDEELGGVGYQKIINDRLLTAFGLKEEPSFEHTQEVFEKLLDQKMKEMREDMEKMLDDKIKQLERKHA